MYTSNSLLLTHYLITEQGRAFASCRSGCWPARPGRRPGNSCSARPRPSAWRPRSPPTGCARWPCAASRGVPAAGRHRGWRRFPSPMSARCGRCCIGAPSGRCPPPSASAVPASSSPAASAWIRSAPGRWSSAGRCWIPTRPACARSPPGRRGPGNGGPPCWPPAWSRDPRRWTSWSAPSRWHPEHRYLEAALALAYWEAQRYPDARRLARQAVDRDPGDPYLLGVYGQCLIAGSACEQGREAIAKALAAASGQGRHFPYDLAWLSERAGCHEASQGDNWLALPPLRAALHPPQPAPRLRHRRSQPGAARPPAGAGGDLPGHRGVRPEAGPD